MAYAVSQLNLALGEYMIGDMYDYTFYSEMLLKYMV